MLRLLREILDPSSPPPRSAPALVLSAGREIEVEGVEGSQAALAEIAGASDFFSLDRSFLARLLPAEDGIHVEVDERCIGKLPPEPSRRYRGKLAPLASKGIPVKCVAILRGRWAPEVGRTRFSLHVSLAEPEQVR